MLLSLLLAWAAVICTAMTALKFVARISKNRSLNRFFRSCHIPFGVLLLITGGIHGLLAGNAAGATLADFQLAPVLLTWNAGTVCLLLAAALGATYLLRRRLKRYWMPAHRALTAALIVCLTLHIAAVGIRLPAVLTGAGETAAQTETLPAASSAASGDSAVSSAASGDSSASSAASGDFAVSSAASGDSSASSAASGDSAVSSAASGDSAVSSGVVTFSGAQLQDGTYQGSADGYKGTVTVSVTVAGGQVTAVQVVSESDTPNFFSRAESVLDEIISGQSLEVDTVTGATFSSAGLINAVADALRGAVTSGTLQVTDIDLSSVSRRG